MPVRLLLGVEALLCAVMAFSPLIVAYAVKPNLPVGTTIAVLAERVAPPLLASFGLIGAGLIGWARHGAKAPVLVLLVFCPLLAALFLAIWGFR